MTDDNDDDSLCEMSFDGIGHALQVELPDELTRAAEEGGEETSGNPFLRLLRREVEALVKKKHGDDYLKDQQVKTELARINRELKRLKTQITPLEEQKSKLIADREK